MDADKKKLEDDLNRLKLELKKATTEGVITGVCSCVRAFAYVRVHCKCVCVCVYIYIYIYYAPKSTYSVKERKNTCARTHLIKKIEFFY